MKKFEIFIEEFTATDDIRIELTGIYHDDGCVVATNGHVLCTMESEYDKEYEGKVSVDGEVLDKRYPNYKAVLPMDSSLANPKLYELVKVDMMGLYNVLRQAAADELIFPNPDVIYRIELRRNGRRYSVALSNVVKFFRFMMMMEMDEFYLPMDGLRPAYAAKGKNRCMVMPIYTEGFSSEYAYVFELK